MLIETGAGAIGTMAGTELMFELMLVGRDLRFLESASPEATDRLFPESGVAEPDNFGEGVCWGCSGDGLGKMDLILDFSML